MTKRILIANYREDGEPGIEMTTVVVSPGSPSMKQTKYSSVAQAAEEAGLAGEWLLAAIEANDGAVAITISTSPAR